MDHAVLMDNEGGTYALIKSSSYERCFAVYGLCRLHLSKLYPEANAYMSEDRRRNLRVDMHPENQPIIARLIALEFALPVPKDILEGEYTVVE